MLKPRTHFEQVPLEIIRKIVEEEMPPEPVNEIDPEINRRKIEKVLRASQKKSKASLRRSSRKEAAN